MEAQQPQAQAAQVPSQVQESHQDPQVQEPSLQDPQAKPLRTRNDPANPGSPAAMAEKKAKLLAMLREEREVPQPTRAPQPPAQPATPKPDAPLAPPVQNDAAKLFAEFQAQQKAAMEAQKLADKKAAELAAKEAAAEAKLKKLEMSLSNPLEFIAEAGMTPEQWTEFLTGDGKLTPEQKRVREAENLAKQAMERAEALEKRLTDERRQLQVQAERSQIDAALGEFPLTKKMGGAAIVQERAQALSQQFGQPVSWQQAAQHLESEYFAGLQAILQDAAIAGKLNIGVSKPQSESAAPTNPTTLGRATAPTSGVKGLSNPRDFAAKKAAFLAMLAQQSK